MYPNPTPIETKLGAWRQNAGNFVGKSRKLTINKALLSISKDTEMDVFRTGDWVNLKTAVEKLSLGTPIITAYLLTEKLTLYRK